MIKKNYRARGNHKSSDGRSIELCFKRILYKNNSEDKDNRFRGVSIRYIIAKLEKRFGGITPLFNLYDLMNIIKGEPTEKREVINALFNGRETYKYLNDYFVSYHHLSKAMQNIFNANEPDEGGDNDDTKTLDQELETWLFNLNWSLTSKNTKINSSGTLYESHH